MGLSDELVAMKTHVSQLEQESKRKDKMIQELERKVEEANNRQSSNGLREVQPMSEEDILKEEVPVKEESNSILRRRQGDLRKSFDNERLEVEEEAEEEEEKDEMGENNGLNAEKDDRMNMDFYKFRKNFNRGKSGEFQPETANNMGPPVLAALNGKRNSDLSLGRSSQMKLDEDDNLNSLLNNFIGGKGSPLKGFGSNKFTAVQKKENEGTQLSSQGDILSSGKMFSTYQVNKDKNAKNTNFGKNELFGQKISFKPVGLTDKNNTSFGKSTEASKPGSSTNLIQKMLSSYNNNNNNKKGGLESLLQSQDDNEEENKASGIGGNYLSFKEVLFNKKKPDQGNAHEFE